jgi:hypothetical protein
VAVEVDGEPRQAVRQVLEAVEPEEELVAVRHLQFRLLLVRSILEVAVVVVLITTAPVEQVVQAWLLSRFLIRLRLPSQAVLHPRYQLLADLRFTP